MHVSGGLQATQAEFSEGVTCLGSGSCPQLSWPTNVVLSPYAEGFWDIISLVLRGRCELNKLIRDQGWSVTMNTKTVAQARGLSCLGLLPIRKNENLWGKQTSQHVIVSRWSWVTLGSCVTKLCRLYFLIVQFVFTCDPSWQDNLFCSR